MFASGLLHEGDGTQAQGDAFDRRQRYQAGLGKAPVGPDAAFGQQFECRLAHGFAMGVRDFMWQHDKQRNLLCRGITTGL